MNTQQSDMDGAPNKRKRSGKFPIRRQLDAMDCGPTCLQMICLHHGKHFALSFLRERCYITREGVSLLGISGAAESVGLRTLAARLSFKELLEEAPLPFIAHWQQRHFVVVYKVSKKKVWVADPAHGQITYSVDEFMAGWSADGQTGIGMFLEVTPTFYQQEDGEMPEKAGWSFILGYLKQHRRYLLQLILGLVLGSLVGLILPFLTQALVDFGINSRDIGFVYTVLLAQIMLFVSRTSVDFLRGWLLLHMGARINISIISDFLAKLMRLPLSFFDGKQLGDLIQRIGDHRRIESFLTSQTLNILFSTINLVVFSVVLAFYSAEIFWLFFIGTLISIGWILIFLKRRRDLDYRLFDRLSESQSNLFELINGMPEIKYNNAALPMRWKWEHIQASQYKVRFKSLALEQYQEAGSMFVNELKNILITFVAAKLVIEGQMTLGMMMAVSYIIGQLNSPVTQLIDFVKLAQDAQLSLERLGEIHSRDNEEDDQQRRLRQLPENRDLVGDKIVFQYEGPHSEKVLDEVSLHIPYHKTTAIVGASGSGKTTLLKVLLRSYLPVSGQLRIGEMNMDGLNADFWREQCGVVMQDGYIFSDTIARNIALSGEQIDYARMMRAAKIANIADFVEKMPLGYETKIGGDGHGLSQGQKQRILIARAVYKDPPFLFFDEATSALDATNEKTIMENLEAFLKERTAVVVAHRLSTVKNADQILVLDKGRVVEQGTHATLTEKRGAYYHLVKNQLELGG